jgi:AcrR family transcriptional regulator
MENKMTRKQQKEERRRAILMTALTLFVERGYYDTKITDIAKAVPMSTGLLFHYFESKEELLVELVKMGLEGTKAAADAPEGVPPDMFLERFLGQMFVYAKEQPWVFNMFVLMGQVRRAGMPEEARNLAMSVDTFAPTSKMIEQGQKAGVFHDGDPYLMATCFWASVQGIMEEMAMNKDMKVPEPSWIVSMLKK